MTTNDHSDQRRTDPRMAYVPLGIDADGRHHTYRTSDESIHVVDDGDRVHHEDIGDRSVDEWMAFVEERVGWDRRDYGLGLAELADRAITVDA